MCLDEVIENKKKPASAVCYAVCRRSYYCRAIKNPKVGVRLESGIVCRDKAGNVIWNDSRSSVLVKRYDGNGHDGDHKAYPFKPGGLYWWAFPEKKIYIKKGIYRTIMQGYRIVFGKKQIDRRRRDRFPTAAYPSGFHRWSALESAEAWDSDADSVVVQGILSKIHTVGRQGGGLVYVGKEFLPQKIVSRVVNGRWVRTRKRR